MPHSHQVEMFGEPPAQSEKRIPQRGPAAKRAQDLNRLPPIQLTENDVRLGKAGTSGRERGGIMVTKHDEGDEVALDVRR